MINLRNLAKSSLKTPGIPQDLEFFVVNINYIFVLDFLTYFVCYPKVNSYVYMM